MDFINEISNLKILINNRIHIDNVIKSITPFLFLIPILLFHKNIPIYWKINTYILLISTLLYHSFLEFTNEPNIIEIFDYFDTFAINLFCAYRIFDNELFALLFAFIFYFYKPSKYFMYCLGLLKVLYLLNNKLRIILFINLFIGLFTFFTRTNQPYFTIAEKFIWHLTTTIYLYIAGFTY